MLRKYLISGLVGMTVFSACKTANTASNAKTEDGSAPSTDDLKSKIEQAYHDTYQMREQTLKQIDLDREMIKDLKLDRDGASRIAKISTAVAATGVLAAGGAAASMVGFSAFLTMGAAPTFFSSAQVLLGTVAFEAADMQLLAGVLATSAVLSAPAVYVLNQVTLANITGGNAKDWDKVAGKAVMALDEVNNALAKVSAMEVPHTNNWGDVLKNSFTFGWYDVYYINKYVSKQEIMLNLHQRKADCLYVLAMAYLHMYNDLGNAN